MGKDDVARVRGVFERRDLLSRSSWFDRGHLFLIQQRERNTLRFLEKHGLEKLEATRILDIGCGDGYWMREFVKWGANPRKVAGLDLLSSRVERAIGLSPNTMSFRVGNAEELPWDVGSFDLVIQSTVFSSILDPAVRDRIGSS